MQKPGLCVDLQRTDGALDRTWVVLQRTGSGQERTGGALERTGAKDRSVVVLQRTGVALQNTDGAIDRTGAALQRSDVASYRTGGATERSRHVLPLEPAAAHTAGPLIKGVESISFHIQLCATRNNRLKPGLLPCARWDVNHEGTENVTRLVGLEIETNAIQFLKQSNPARKIENSGNRGCC